MRRGPLRAAGLVVVLALAACARIPTSGAVRAGIGEVPQQGSVVVLAAGPQPNSQPEQIVGDFLLAGAAGLSGRPLDFTVARQYLSGDAAATWNPLGGVLVVDGYRPPERTTDTQVTVETSVLGSVDADGRFAEAPQASRQTVTFDMVQDTAGQWRIADAPAGLILPVRQFQDQFRAASLYFLSPDDTYLVPDPRWYPAANLPTSVVKGLLAGPSPWLRDAVRTAVPQGVTLAPEAVPVNAGVAEVDLAPALTVQGAERDLLVAQIEATLTQVTQVRAVSVRAGANGPELQGNLHLTTAGAADPPIGPPEMLSADPTTGDRLVSLNEGRLTPVEGVGALVGLDARSPARSEDGSVRALLSGSGVLALAPTATRPMTPLLQGPGLAAPSVDRFGWVWTASGSAVLAVDAQGHKVTVPVPWLADRQVKALRVSRDGTRIAIVSSGQDGVAVDVAGIARDASGGPQQLGERAPRVGAVLTAADAVVWIDDSLLAVLSIDAASATVWEVPVGGPSRALPDVKGAVGIAGGKTDRSLLVATQDGELLRYNGPTWTQVTGIPPVRYPSFPG